jgi:uncharacterized membrane protein YidH (DUF202 family)
MPTHKPSKEKPLSESLLLSELQLVLAEKRTYLSILRTGLAVFTVPLTVIAFLGATAEYHGIFTNAIVAIVVVGGLAIISVIGLIIFYISQRKLRRLNTFVYHIKEENKRIAEIVV